MSKRSSENIFDYWIHSSDEDFETMIVLYNSKRYNWALFVAHLMIEKLLKAYYLKIKSDHPPYTHNLLRLAEFADIELSEEEKVFFATVTAFNINARYDDYKKSFQKICTKEYAEIWIDEIKKKREWIKELLK